MSEQTHKTEGGREREQRIEKLKQLRGMGVNPYRYSFERTHMLSEAVRNEEELTGASAEVVCAGRLMSLRKHGKTAFGNIKDSTASLQFYVRKDSVDEGSFDLFKLIDVGDIVGVYGTLFRTKTEELTVKVTRLELLSKALLPLPEKWHGLQDKEIRYRRRYVDLIVNDDVIEVFRARSAIVETIRRFLLEHGFLEVETPILQPIYGGALARPFVTHHNTLDIDLYLRIADELYLKRLIVGGMERVFEFSKDFRNEGMDRSHNPEFTMLECYVAYWDYMRMMEFVEQLFARLCEEFVGGFELKFGEHEIDLKSPWRRLSFFDAIGEATDEDLREMDAEALKELAKKLRSTMIRK